MVPQLLQPSGDVLVCLQLADVVHKKRSNGASIVGRGNGSVSFLASRVPDLCFDGLRIDLNGPGRKLHSDGGLGIKVELVAREPAQQIGLSDAGVTNKDDCKISSAQVPRIPAGWEAPLNRNCSRH